MSRPTEKEYADAWKVGKALATDATSHRSPSVTMDPNAMGGTGEGGHREHATFGDAALLVGMMNTRSKAAKSKVVIDRERRWAEQQSLVDFIMRPCTLKRNMEQLFRVACSHGSDLQDGLLSFDNFKIFVEGLGITTLTPYNQFEPLATLQVRERISKREENVMNLALLRLGVENIEIVFEYCTHQESQSNGAVRMDFNMFLVMTIEVLRIMFPDENLYPPMAKQEVHTQMLNNMYFDKFGTRYMQQQLPPHFDDTNIPSTLARVVEQHYPSLLELFLACMRPTTFKTLPMTERERLRMSAVISDNYVEFEQLCEVLKTVRLEFATTNTEYIYSMFTKYNANAFQDRPVVDFYSLNLIIIHLAFSQYHHNTNFPTPQAKFVQLMDEFFKEFLGDVEADALTQTASEPIQLDEVKPQKATKGTDMFLFGKNFATKETHAGSRAPVYVRFGVDGPTIRGDTMSTTVASINVPQLKDTDDSVVEAHLTVKDSDYKVCIQTTSIVPVFVSSERITWSQKLDRTFEYEETVVDIEMDNNFINTLRSVFQTFAIKGKVFDEDEDIRSMSTSQTGFHYLYLKGWSKICQSFPLGVADDGDESVMIQRHPKFFETARQHSKSPNITEPSLTFEMFINLIFKIFIQQYGSDERILDYVEVAFKEAAQVVEAVKAANSPARRVRRKVEDEPRVQHHAVTQCVNCGQDPAVKLADENIYLDLKLLQDEKKAESPTEPIPVTFTKAVGMFTSALPASGEEIPDDTLSRLSAEEASKLSMRNQFIYLTTLLNKFESQEDRKQKEASHRFQASISQVKSSGKFLTTQLLQLQQSMEAIADSVTRTQSLLQESLQYARDERKMRLSGSLNASDTLWAMSMQMFSGVEAALNATRDLTKAYLNEKDNDDDMDIQSTLKDAKTFKERLVQQAAALEKTILKKKNEVVSGPDVVKVTKTVQRRKSMSEEENGPDSEEEREKLAASLTRKKSMSSFRGVPEEEVDKRLATQKEQMEMQFTVKVKDLEKRKDLAIKEGSALLFDLLRFTQELCPIPQTISNPCFKYLQNRGLHLKKVAFEQKKDQQVAIEMKRTVVTDTQGVQSDEHEFPSVAEMQNELSIRGMSNAVKLGPCAVMLRRALCCGRESLTKFSNNPSLFEEFSRLLKLELQNVLSARQQTMINLPSYGDMHVRDSTTNTALTKTHYDVAREYVAYERQLEELQAALSASPKKKASKATKAKAAAANAVQTNPADKKLTAEQRVQKKTAKVNIDLTDEEYAKAHLNTKECQTDFVQQNRAPTREERERAKMSRESRQSEAYLAKMEADWADKESVGVQVGEPVDHCECQTEVTGEIVTMEIARFMRDNNPLAQQKVATPPPEPVPEKVVAPEPKPAAKQSKPRPKPTKEEPPKKLPETTPPAAGKLNEQLKQIKKPVEAVPEPAPATKKRLNQKEKKPALEGVSSVSTTSPVGAVPEQPQAKPIESSTSSSSPAAVLSPVESAAPTPAEASKAPTPPRGPEQNVVVDDAAAGRIVDEATTFATKQTPDDIVTGFGTLSFQQPTPPANSNNASAIEEKIPAQDLADVQEGPSSSSQDEPVKDSRQVHLSPDLAKKNSNTPLRTGSAPTMGVIPQPIKLKGAQYWDDEADRKTYSSMSAYTHVTTPPDSAYPMSGTSSPFADHYARQLTAPLTPGTELRFLNGDWQAVKMSAGNNDRQSDSMLAKREMNKDYRDKLISASDQQSKSTNEEAEKEPKSAAGTPPAEPVVVEVTKEVIIEKEIIIRETTGGPGTEDKSEKETLKLDVPAKSPKPTRKSAEKSRLSPVSRGQKLTPAASHSTHTTPRRGSPPPGVMLDYIDEEDEEDEEEELRKALEVEKKKFEQQLSRQAARQKQRDQLKKQIEALKVVELEQKERYNQTRQTEKSDMLLHSPGEHAQHVYNDYENMNISGQTTGQDKDRVFKTLMKRLSGEKEESADNEDDEEGTETDVNEESAMTNTTNDYQGGVADDEEASLRKRNSITESAQQFLKMINEDPDAAANFIATVGEQSKSGDTPPDTAADDGGDDGKKKPILRSRKRKAKPKGLAAGGTGVEMEKMELSAFDNAAAEIELQGMADLVRQMRSRVADLEEEKLVHDGDVDDLKDELANLRRQAIDSAAGGSRPMIISRSKDGHTEKQLKVAKMLVTEKDLIRTRVHKILKAYAPEVLLNFQKNTDNTGLFEIAELLEKEFRKNIDITSAQLKKSAPDLCMDMIRRHFPTEVNEKLEMDFTADKNAVLKVASRKLYDMWRESPSAKAVNQNDPMASVYQTVLDKLPHCNVYTLQRLESIISAEEIGSQFSLDMASLQTLQPPAAATAGAGGLGASSQLNQSGDGRSSTAGGGGGGGPGWSFSDNRSPAISARGTPLPQMNLMEDIFPVAEHTKQARGFVGALRRDIIMVDALTQTANPPTFFSQGAQTMTERLATPAFLTTQTTTDGGSDALEFTTNSPLLGTTKSGLPIYTDQQPKEFMDAEVQAVPFVIRKVQDLKMQERNTATQTSDAFSKVMWEEKMPWRTQLARLFSQSKQTLQSTDIIVNWLRGIFSVFQSKEPEFLTVVARQFDMLNTYLDEFEERPVRERTREMKVQATVMKMMLKALDFVNDCCGSPLAEFLHDSAPQLTNSSTALVTRELGDIQETNYLVTNMFARVDSRLSNPPETVRNNQRKLNRWRHVIIINLLSNCDKEVQCSITPTEFSTMVRLCEFQSLTAQQQRRLFYLQTVSLSAIIFSHATKRGYISLAKAVDCATIVPLSYNAPSQSHLKMAHQAILDKLIPPAFSEISRESSLTNVSQTSMQFVWKILSFSTEEYNWLKSMSARSVEDDERLKALNAIPEGLKHLNPAYSTVSTMTWLETLRQTFCNMLGQSGQNMEEYLQRPRSEPFPDETSEGLDQSRSSNKDAKKKKKEEEKRVLSSKDAMPAFLEGVSWKDCAHMRTPQPARQSPPPRGTPPPQPYAPATIRSPAAFASQVPNAWSKNTIAAQPSTLRQEMIEFGVMGAGVKKTGGTVAVGGGLANAAPPNMGTANNLTKQLFNMHSATTVRQLNGDEQRKLHELRNACSGLGQAESASANTVRQWLELELRSCVQDQRALSGMDGELSLDGVQTMVQEALLQVTPDAAEHPSDALRHLSNAQTRLFVQHLRGESLRGKRLPSLTAAPPTGVAGAAPSRGDAPTRGSFADRVDSIRRAGGRSSNNDLLDSPVQLPPRSQSSFN